MRIGLIGNMNNNNFALLRYFRDLGHDAYLLLWANDGVGDLSHFDLENDTWEIKKWSDYIIKTEVLNAPISVFEPPISGLIWLRGEFSNLFRKIKIKQKPVNKNRLRAIFGGYDILIGSGLSPAILSRCNVSLDLFYPYGTRVEFLENGEIKNQVLNGNVVASFLSQKVIEKQLKGIRAARNVLDLGVGPNIEVFRRYGVKSTSLLPPIVYNLENSLDQCLSEKFHRLVDEISSAEIVLLNHARLYWVNKRNYSEQDWVYETKNSDWLFHGLYQFKLLKPNTRVKVIVIEYGPDIQETKELIKDLNLTNNIIWLSKSKRKELMLLMQKVDMVVGEFSVVNGMLWGSTCWEGMASGKPVLQSFNFESEKFEQIYGLKAPPILDVKSSKDICSHLSDFSSSKNSMRLIGMEMLNWFNSFNGYSSARSIIDLIIKDRL